MKFTRKTQIMILVVVTVLLLIGLSVYAMINRKRNKEEIEELYRLIRKGVGALGNDFKTLLDKVAPDNRNQSRLLNAAKSIYGAFYWTDVLGFKHRNIDDDEEAVLNTLKKLTKGEVKAMMNVFAKEYGVELDDFLKSYNSETELKSYYTVLSNLN